MKRDLRNVMLSCAGRRAYLVGWFREALDGSGKVIGIDSDPLAAAMAEVDVSVVVPPVSDPSYLQIVLNLCEKHEIGMIVSLNDMELSLLAGAKQQFADRGIHVLGAGSEAVKTCLDKKRTKQLAAAAGLNYPRTFFSMKTAQAWWKKDGSKGKLVVKPRWGTGSIGVEIVDCADDLEAAWRLCSSRVRNSIVKQMSECSPASWVICQEWVVGQEFGLDIVNNLQGDFVCGLGRRKLAMRAGETDKAESVVSDELTRIAAAIGIHIQHTGLIDCDLIHTGSAFVLLEVNPRFGGGYPFSHAAGANIPAALLAWMNGRTAKKQWLQVRQGVISAKADRLVHVGTSGDVGPASPE